MNSLAAFLFWVCVGGFIFDIVCFLTFMRVPGAEPTFFLVAAVGFLIGAYLHAQRAEK